MKPISSMVGRTAFTRRKLSAEKSARRYLMVNRLSKFLNLVASRTQTGLRAWLSRAPSFTRPHKSISLLNLFCAIRGLMTFYEFKDDIWINLAQITRVTIGRTLTIQFSDGTKLEEENRNFIDLFLKAMKAHEFDQE